MYLDEFTLVEMVMENFQVTILKPSSQETTTWSEFYAIAHSVMFVVDSADLSRMKETKKTLKKVISHPFIAGKPILMWAMQRNGPWACVDIQRSQLGKEIYEKCKCNCNYMFSGSPINKIRRKHWIKQKLWRSSTWRGSSTNMRVRVILWAAVHLYRDSFHRGGWIFKSRRDHSRAGLSLHQIAYSALPAYIEIANKMMKDGQEWLFNVLDLNYEFIEYRVLKDLATQAAQRELFKRGRLLVQIHERWGKQVVSRGKSQLWHFLHLFFNCPLRYQGEP